MEAMREGWTDDRLDHLSARMDERFDGVDRRFDEVDRRFAEVDRRFVEVDRRLERIETGQRDQRADIAAMRTSIEVRFDTTQYMIIRVGAGIFGTVFIGFLSLLLAQS